MNPSWPSGSYRMLVELEDRSKIWFIIPSCTYFILMSSRSKFSFRSVHTCMMKIVSEQLNENWLYRFASHYILPVCNNILLFIERLDFVEILLSTIYYLQCVASPKFSYQQYRYYYDKAIPFKRRRFTREVIILPYCLRDVIIMIIITKHLQTVKSEKGVRYAWFSVLLAADQRDSYGSFEYCT